MSNLREEGNREGGTMGTREGRYEEEMRKEGRGNGLKKMWGTMKDREEVLKRDRISYPSKMLQLRPEPTQ